MYNPKAKAAVFFLFFSLSLPCIQLNALDIPEFSSDAPTVFINEIGWMMSINPHSFPVNTFVYYEGYNREGSGNSDFNNARFMYYIGTIIGIPFVDWLSVSGNATIALNVAESTGEEGMMTESDLNNMALNFFGNAGVILDFSFATFGIFGGFYSDIMEDIFNISSPEDVEKEFKFAFMPAVKMSEWFSFINSIDSYIHIGRLDKKNNIDFGQRFIFPAFNIADNPFSVVLLYKNERFNKLTRNWAFGTELKYGQKFYASLDAGYRIFYDVPDETELNNSLYARLVLGYESAVGGNGLLVSASHDASAWGIGAGLRLFRFELYAEMLLRDTTFEQSAFRISARSYSKPRPKPERKPMPDPEE